jgi:hypothetical protein
MCLFRKFHLQVLQSPGMRSLLPVNKQFSDKCNAVNELNRQTLIKVLVIVFIVFCGFVNTYGQEKILERPFSFSYGTIRLSSFLDSLNVDCGIAFSYDASLINGDTLIQANADSVLLDKWVLYILDRKDLRIHQIENQIIISEEPARITQKSIHIKGTVIDSLSREPLSMVNIGVKGKTIGTATNKDGQFSLFLPSGYEGETLVFSNLGFLRDSIFIPPRDTIVTIKLAETSVHLPEVLIRFVQPEKIMQEVVRRKDENYPSETLILTAFFRETIQQDEQYVDVSEAVIEVYKPPYSSGLALERVRFVRGRKGEFAGNMDLIDFKLQGGPFLFSRVDIVRQGGFLPDQEGNSRYRYSFEGMDYEYGRNVFVIGFEPRNDTGELLYEGEIRVDEETFAVVGANFEMTNKTIRKSRDYLIRRDSRRYRTKPVFAGYQIYYRPWGNKWVLNSVRGEMSMKISDRKKNVRTHFDTVSEMLVTDLRAGDRKEFKWSESFKPDYILSDEIESYDPEFWSHYNIISPDESIKKIFRDNDKTSSKGETDY